MFDNIAKDTTGKVVDIAKQKAEQVVDQAVDGATSYVAGQLNNALSSIDMSKVGLSSTNVFSVSPDAVKNIFTQTSKIFTNKTIDNDKTLNDTKAIVNSASTNNTSTYTTMSEGLSNSKSGESTKDALSFITSTTKDVVDGISSAAGGLFSGITDAITSLPGAMLDKLGEIAGDVVGNISGFVEGFESAIVDGVGGFLSKSGELLSGVVDTVVGGVSSVVDGVGTVFDGIGNVVSSVTGSLSGVISKLPSEVTDIIGDAAEDVVDATVANLKTSILNKAPFLSEMTDLDEKLYSYVSTSNNPLITDALGLPATGFGSNTSYDDLSTYVELAKKLCINVDINLDNYNDYGTNKTLYDILVELMASIRNLDLLQQLLNCDKYFDNKTVETLTPYFDTANKSGDVQLANTIYQYIGNSNVSDPKKSIRTLLANTNTYHTQQSKDTIANMANAMGITIEEVYMDNTNTESYDAEYILGMSVKGNFIRNVISDDTYKTNLAVYQYFGNA